MLNSDELVCKPLHTYKELLDFVNNPPVWKSMCKDLKTHSEHSIRNCEEKSCFSQVILENALAYCHFDPDLDEAPSRHKRCHLPKTLVCHDMANGYHDDRLSLSITIHRAIICLQKYQLSVLNCSYRWLYNYKLAF